MLEKQTNTLAKRIIPCLDVKDGRVVKGVCFLDLVDAGDPLENAITYEKQGADELVFLDITATSDKRDIILSLVKSVSERLFIPYTVGGGVRTVEDIRLILHEGSDKVAINTAGFQNPQIFKEASRIFGSQCLVCAIDAKFNGNFYEVYLDGGRTPTGKDAVLWAKEAESAGAGEILLTSMDRDGTKRGYELELTRKVVQQVHIPVIASGGAGCIDDFEDAFNVGASAALAASLFHFNEVSIPQLKESMTQKKIPVRTLNNYDSCSQSFK